MVAYPIDLGRSRCSVSREVARTYTRWLGALAFRIPEAIFDEASRTVSSALAAANAARRCEKPTTFVRMPKTATGMRQDGAPPASDEINPSKRHSHYI